MEYEQPKLLGTDVLTSTLFSFCWLDTVNKVSRNRKGGMGEEAKERSFHSLSFLPTKNTVSLAWTLWWPREWDGSREGGREAQEGGDIDIIMTDSHCYMAETNTTLQSSYTPIRKKETLWTVTWEINFYDDKVNLFVMANSPLIQYCTLYKLSEIYLSSS